MITITISESKHAPLFERYMPSGGYEPVGEEGEYGRIDPQTDEQYTALVGRDNSYSRDYKIGAAYPPTVFVQGVGPEDVSLTHNELGERMQQLGIWSNNYKPVRIPRGFEYGEATWYEGFKYSPINMKPRLDRLAAKLEQRAEVTDVHRTQSSVEAWSPEAVQHG